MLSGMASSVDDVQNEILLECAGDSSRESGIMDSVLGDEIVEGNLPSEQETKNDDDFVGSGPAEDIEAAGQSTDKEQQKEDGEGESLCFIEGVSNAVVKEVRSSVKKQHGFDAGSSQQRRREHVLQLQRQRRDEILDKIRQLEDSAYSDSETEDEMDFVATVRKTSGHPTTLENISENTSGESMDTATTSTKSHRSIKKNRANNLNKRKRHRKPPCRVMLSEWLLERPEDFEEMWIGALCPVGKRCVVVATRGKTKIFSRTDEYLGSYKSLLPGGCAYYYGDTNVNRYRGVTILDCVWSQLSETFYVLDLICWNSHSCVNCDTDYRQFFLHSKFSENLELLERSKLNPFPFKPLPYFAAREMPLVMASSVLFPECVDGILLMHRETFYIPDTNPLCLWILPSQVEATLGVYVSPDLLARQGKVKNLNSRLKQIKDAKEMEINEG
ncbi:Snurportin-1, partial [Orchesella cincta]